MTAVDADDETFTVDTGLQKITVEADELGYNPLDELGYQTIEQGDRVSVSGSVDYQFFDGRVFEAQSVVTLSDASREG